MSFSGPQEDRITIGELLASYGDTISLKDFEGWVALWSADSIWLHPAFEGPTMKDELGPVIRGMFESVTTVHFMSSPGMLAIEGNTATGRCWIREAIARRDGVGYLTNGMYDDHYVKQAGRWLFRQRRFTLLCQFELVLSV